MRLFTLALWGVLAIGGLELAFRAFVFPDYQSLARTMYVPHAVFGSYTKANLDVRRFNPGNYDVRNHTNARGMRGRDEDLERELAGIWVGGDSNTFGGFVADDEVYVHRLRHRGYWAANLASEGTFLTAQMQVIRSLAAEGKRPRAVLVGLSLFQSLKPYEECQAKLAAPLPAVAAVASPVTEAPAKGLLHAVRRFGEEIPTNGMRVRSRLIASSATYGWIKTDLLASPNLRDILIRWGLREDVDMVMSGPLDLFQDNAKGAAAIAGTARCVAAVAQWVRSELHVPFGVVLLPNHHLIQPARFERWQQAHGLSGLDPVKPVAALAAALEEAGVPVVDPLPALRAAGRAMTFLDDGHLTADAHAIVSDQVARFLRDRLAVEAER
jgi:hypothetical protein